MKCEGGNLAGVMKLRVFVLLGATGELVSGAIGIACPPIAYKFDEWIQSNYLIHSWYVGSYLSLWSYEVRGREIGEEDIGLGGAFTDTGNEHRMELKKERVKGDIKFYQAGYASLGQFVAQGVISTPSEDILNMIGMLGTLNAKQEGRSLSTIKADAIDASKVHEKDKKQKTIDEHEELFLKYWATLNDNPQAHARNFMSRIPFLGTSEIPLQFNYNGPLFNSEMLHKLILFELIMQRDPMTVNDETYFAGGVEGRQNIQNALMHVYFKEEVENLYKTDAEVAKHVDAFFGVFQGFDEQRAHLKSLQDVIKGPQSTDRAAMVARMEASATVGQASAALRGSFATAQKQAREFFIERKLLVGVVIDGHQAILRDVVQEMNSKLSAFTSDMFSAGREMYDVVTRAVFPSEES